MKIINIDYNTIADWQNKLRFEFIKSFPDINYPEIDLSNVDLNELWKYFEFPLFEHIETDYDSDGKQNNEGVSKVIIDVKNETNANPEYFKQFMSDHIVEIFGMCNERHKSIINSLNYLINKGYEVNVISNLKGKIRSAIYFFLSKNLYTGNVLYKEDIIDVVNINEFNDILEQEKENEK